jgi:penicillin-binding protein-related factor A (putative recombinase)
MRGGVRAIPTKTPFDFVMCRDGIAVFFDAKSTSAKTFAASAIQLHQLYHLARVENAGFRSGYVVYFQETDEVVFFSASQLAKLKRGDSLKPDDGLQLGSALTLTLLPLFFD